MPTADSKAARTTVTIPPDVRASMNAVTVAVNWSAVATEAFRAKLLDIESKKVVTKMDDVIERLRASKKKHNDAMYQGGLEAGKYWAREKAEAFELENIASAAVPILAEYGSFADYLAVAGNDDNHNESPGSAAHKLITREQENFVAAGEFWEAVIGESASKTSSRSFVTGFLDAAHEVWRTVEPKL